MDSGSAEIGRGFLELVRLVEGDHFEHAARIGVEQELFLIHPSGRPNNSAARLVGDHFEHELAASALEFQTPPIVIDGSTLPRLRAMLASGMPCGEPYRLTGMLETARASDMRRRAPLKRYDIIDEAIHRRRGEGVEICGRYFRGIMASSVCAAFHINTQVHPDDFAKTYNAALFLAAPILALCSETPTFMGERHGWRHGRIDVFERSLADGSRPSRVGLGTGWASNAIDTFAELLRVPALVPNERAGLEAMDAHVGTTWRWVRPRVAIADGVPQMRIEFRPISAGPDVDHEIMLVDFYLRCLRGIVDQFGDVANALDFDTMRDGFYAVARDGEHGRFVWPGLGWVTGLDAGRMLRSLARSSGAHRGKLPV